MRQLLSDYAYFVLPLTAWLVAQVVKIFIIGFKQNVWDWRYIYRSGGMPSAHTTVIVSLCVVLAYRLGTKSPEFGIACILASIVMYDAMNVRHAVGEHGKVLRQILPKILKGQPAKMIIHQSNGHTPAEVFAGVVVGVLVPTIILILN